MWIQVISKSNIFICESHPQIFLGTTAPLGLGAHEQLWHRSTGASPDGLSCGQQVNTKKYLKTKYNPSIHCRCQASLDWSCQCSLWAGSVPNWSPCGCHLWGLTSPDGCHLAGQAALLFPGFLPRTTENHPAWPQLLFSPVCAPMCPSPLQALQLALSPVLISWVGGR